MLKMTKQAQFGLPGRYLWNVFLNQNQMTVVYTEEINYKISSNRIK
ncbi:hypothetical protein CoNPh26_CDS0114 [Staphylococcus phage S-CoN_Ph26]|nr:hypothetical protein CoNPh26_CDS0114 [Staphylococcus phage S-CoN_Ph26]